MLAAETIKINARHMFRVQMLHMHNNVHMIVIGMLQPCAPETIPERLSQLQGEP